jgi:DNA-binding transcriptional LysR family regulator
LQIMQTSTSARFALSSEQCEVLAAFEIAGSLVSLSRAMRRDVSVLSRSLQAIAAAAPVLEKAQGRWRLTELGVAVARWSRDAVATQRRVLAQQPELRIATTREFAARVLSPGLHDLVGDAPPLVHVSCAEDGVERSLLEGRADLGFDCGRPRDPQIRFRGIAPEPFATVIAPRLAGAHRVRRAADLVELPYLEYTRASATTLLRLDRELRRRYALFNDVASTREAAVAGLGWSILPRYAVDRELRAGSLISVPGWQIDAERFGVWWLAARSGMEAWVEQATRWLRAQDLSGAKRATAR